MSNPTHTNADSNRRSKWLRFGTRTLLFATLICAILSAWLGQHLLRARTQRPIVASIFDAGGSVGYDYHDAELPSGQQFVAPGPNVVRKVLGDDIFATVTTVYLREPTTTDKDVTNLHRLPHLRDVALHGTGITDRCIDDLLRISQLRGLSLSETSITPGGLRRLGASDKLAGLTLWGNNVTDGHIAALPYLENLEHLQVLRSSITDAALDSISQLDSLVSLDIWWANNVTDTGVQSLEELRSLKHLKLLETQLTDASMRSISELTALELLQLDGHPITDAGALHLANLPKLRGLWMSHTQISDIALQTIGDLPLEFLTLTGTSVTDDGIHLLTRTKTLASVELEINNGVSLGAAQSLKDALPDCAIRCVDFDGSTGTITDL